MGGIYLMGTKECTCGEHRVLYGIVESLYCTPGTNITLYVNSLELKLKLEKER